jgi:hypothetical protein
MSDLGGGEIRCSPAEILKVTPDFIQQLGLGQSLTPSRSNGFLNMLLLMQKKTVLMCAASQEVSFGDTPNTTNRTRRTRCGGGSTIAAPAPAPRGRMCTVGCGKEEEEA